jgi:hypothetical protein
MAEPLEQLARAQADEATRPVRLLGWRTLRGASGQHYPFGILDTAGVLPRSGGVYCLARRKAHANGILRTDLLRIGQSADLYENFAGTGQSGFDAVCVYLEENEFQRHLILRDVARGRGLTKPSGRRIQR